MLWHPQYVSGSGHCCGQAHPVDRTESAMAASRGIAATLWLAVEGWSEALAACRDYEQLRSRGVAHDAALRHALGAGPAPAQHRCRSTHPLDFAGRA
jgi:hypothetical protein